MFFVEQSPCNKKYYISQSDDVRKYFQDLFSYAITPSRVLNLTYAQYLRFARDRYHGELYGKQGYPIVYFSDKKDATNLVILLNKYWRKGMKKS